MVYDKKSFETTNKKCADRSVEITAAARSLSSQNKAALLLEEGPRENFSNLEVSSGKSVSYWP